MPLLAWLALAVTALALVLLWRRLAAFLRQWRHLKHLPSPPVTHWLSGHVSAFLATDAPLTLSAWARACGGGAYRLRFFNALGVVVTDPGLVRAVLQNSRTYIPKDRRLYRAIEVAGCTALPNILTSSDGDYWRLVRGAWMKCFTSPHLKRVLPILQDICARVTQQIKQQAAAPATRSAVVAPPAGDAGTAAADATAAAAAAAAAAAEHPSSHCTANGGSNSSSKVKSSKSGSSGGGGGASQPGAVLVNMCNITDRITLDVIGHVSYGRDFGAVDHRRSRYLELVSGMLALMHEEMDHPWKKLLQRLRPDRAKALLRADWDAANTAEVMRALADPPPEHTIAGQLLGVLDPATGKGLTPQQLKSEMAIATLAGFETTSNALSWTLGALACHPEALARLEQELDGAGLLVAGSGSSGGGDSAAAVRFEWPTLGKLPYLQAVIREGLRLFSPASNGTWRLCATTDIRLRDDLVIPKDTAVGVPLFAFGHSPDIYGPDVEDFRPERWLAGLKESSSSSGGRAAPAAGDSASSLDGDAAARGGEPRSEGCRQRPGAAAGPLPRLRSSGNALQDPWSFSIGPRDCAGQGLARLELQVVIASIVGHFALQLAPEVGGWRGLLTRRMYHTTLQIRGGLPMLLTPRASGGGGGDGARGGRDCKVS